MNKFDFKKLLPYLAAIAIFILISVVYFSPLLEGKVISQGDITHHKAMSKEIADFRSEQHKEPLWTNSMFGGMPAYQISVLYPSNLIRFVDTIFTKMIPHPAGYVFLYMLGFFILLIALKVDPWTSIAGAIGFGLSSYFLIIIQAGHNSKAHAIGYMAPVLAGLIMTYSGKKIFGGILFALALALQVGANHLQITYYLAIILLVYIITEVFAVVKNKSYKDFMQASAILMFASIIAIGVNITNLWSTYEYGKYSTRGKSELTTNKSVKTDGLDKDYATDWSYGVSESFSLMVPNFKGGESAYISKSPEALSDVDPQLKEQISQQNHYWGDQPFTSGPVYVGAILCFLFVLGAFIVEGRIKWFLVITTVLSILLAWGKNFMPLTDFFLDYVPGYNKFRAVSMILVIAEFTIPLLAILTLKELFNNANIIKEKSKQFYVSFGLTGGLALLFWLMPTMFNTFVTTQERQAMNDQIKTLQADPNNAQQIGQATEYFQQITTNLEKARISIFKSDSIRSFLFILIAATVIFLFSKNIIKRNALIAILVLLILCDLWIIDKRYLNSDNFVSKQKNNEEFAPTAADEYILKDKTLDYRVLNIATNTFNDAQTSYYHKSIGGYHGAKLKRYQELIENGIVNEIQHFTNTLKNSPTDSTILLALSRMPLINMLNTKYIIYNPGAPAITNRMALGNAWIVSKINIVKNADEELAKIKTINPRYTAVVDQRYESIAKNTSEKDAKSTIQLTSYQPNELKYDYNAPKEQTVIFSEIYYDKGWNAYVDGNKTPYFRANYVLRGMNVPAGKHTIEFKFEPVAYNTGEAISIISSIILLLGIFGSGFYFYKKKQLL